MPLDPSAVREAFVVRYRADRAADVHRSAAEYLDLFPGADVLVCREFAALESEAEESADPSRVGPYRIERELGRGAQGVVYLAHDRRLPRRVALKILRTFGVDDPDILLRFRREAEVASRLDHPGICGVLEAGTSAGRAYLAMRYVEGETLASILARQRSGSTEPETAHVCLTTATSAEELGSEEREPSAGPKASREITAILRSFEKVARALQVAHDAQIIHRDIKPGNLMLTKEGEPVILDFGLAREIDGDSPSITQSGDLFGTPAYMSPEQLLAHRVDLDGRTDVYSLGITLYESLTLRRPFEAPTREALFHAIQTEEAADPRRHNRALPRDLVVVLQTAIAKDRNRRYQSALEFAEDLRRLRMHEAIHARPLPWWTRVGLWARRHPGVAAASFVGLLMFSIGFIATALEKGRAEDALNDWERLADMVRVEELVQEADVELWPVGPQIVGPADAWIQRAESLRARAHDHESALADLRTRALPETQADRKRDRELHEQAKRIAAQPWVEAIAVTRESISQCHALLAAVQTQSTTGAVSGFRRSEGEARRDSEQTLTRTIQETEQRLLNLLAEDKSLQDQPVVRRTWRFAEPKDSLRHDQLARLAELLRSLESDLGPARPTIPDVQRRRERGASLASRTVTAYAGEWGAAVARTSARSEFSKTPLTPVPGLVPLGRDPDTGFELFCDLETGRPPTLDPAGRVLMDGDCGLVFVLLPGGLARLGTQQNDPEGALYDPFADADDREVVDVELEPFFISIFEMTQGQWRRATGSNPSAYYPGKGWRLPLVTPVNLRHPVESMTWSEAVTALQRLGLDLPTEAQWEYASRGGSKHPWISGEDEEDAEGVANLADLTLRESYADPRWPIEPWKDGWAVHAPVGLFNKNRFGLFDVHGNVWEWCRDPYLQSGRKLRQKDGLLRLDLHTDSRAVRGGCFNELATRARLGNRFGLQASHRQATLGVRPVRAWHL